MAEHYMYLRMQQKRDDIVVMNIPSFDTPIEDTQRKSSSEDRAFLTWKNIEEAETKKSTYFNS